MAERNELTSQGSDVRSRLPYEAPRLERLGSVRALTLGAGGSLVDVPAGTPAPIP
ncbi:MAG TPA: lasso RiPP family leader peptide-containing protein [Mycobacteriales bacterium]|nr:lasso RiPP family leader peptide-containing protein [Mycobacteriales bacterium]